MKKYKYGTIFSGRRRPVWHLVKDRSESGGDSHARKVERNPERSLRRKEILRENGIKQMRSPAKREPPATARIPRWPSRGRMSAPGASSSKVEGFERAQMNDSKKQRTAVISCRNDRCSGLPLRNCYFRKALRRNGFLARQLRFSIVPAICAEVCTICFPPKTVESSSPFWDPNSTPS